MPRVVLGMGPWCNGHDCYNDSVAAADVELAFSVSSHHVLVATTLVCSSTSTTWTPCVCVAVRVAYDSVYVCVHEFMLSSQRCGVC